jgi:hypothetical protein
MMEVCRVSVLNPLKSNPMFDSPSKSTPHVQPKEMSNVFSELQQNAAHFITSIHCNKSISAKNCSTKPQFNHTKS